MVRSICGGVCVSAIILNNRLKGVRNVVSLERENNSGLKSLSSKSINGNTFSRTLFFIMKVVLE